MTIVLLRIFLRQAEMKRTLALVLVAVCAGMIYRAPAQNVGNSIDRYFGDWRTSAPHTIRGSLQESDLFTRGNAMNPSQKGGVLRYVNSYSYASLPPHASTKAASLDGQQEIYFVESGSGSATAANQIVDLRRNLAVLVPANLEFTIRNTGEQPLTMYVINEPTPPGFRPNSTMLVRDESMLPISSSNGMWSHIVKTLFVTADGLATLQSVLTVTLDPLTIGKPHPVPGEDSNEIEEVWTALDGTSLAFVGNQLRRQTPGMALYHIPDNTMPHTNINQSEDTQVRFLYFARYRQHELRP
jgi:mannose-6-phosphate isomerase-like protein (cupin superfamily)